MGNGKNLVYVGLLEGKMTKNQFQDNWRKQENLKNPYKQGVGYPTYIRDCIIYPIYMWTRKPNIYMGLD